MIMDVAVSPQLLLPTKKPAKKVKLQRELKYTSGTSLNVGIIIGAGIFASPSVVLVGSGSVGLSLVIWVVCGLLSLGAALCYIELGCMLPQGGSEYVYLRKAFGPLVSFMWIFAMVFIIRPASSAMIALTFGNYVMEAFYPNCSSEDMQRGAKVLAMLCICFVLLINCYSVKLAARVQVTFTTVKLIAIIIIAFSGMVRLVTGHTDSFAQPFRNTSTSFSGVGYAFYGSLFAYNGWNNLNIAVEELENPNKNLPLSITSSVLVVVICYVCTNLAYLTVLSPLEIASSNAVAVTFANKLFGVVWWIMPVLVACSCFGAVNGGIFVGGRIYYLAARDGLMPKLFAMLHSHRMTPIPALIIKCIVSVLMLAPNSSDFESMVKYYGFINWLFYALAILSLLWFRHRYPELHRPFKVFIIVPIIVLGASAYLSVAFLLQDPVPTIVTFILVLCSIPLYTLFVKWKIQTGACEQALQKLTWKLQVLGDLSLPTLDGDEEEQNGRVEHELDDHSLHNDDDLLEEDYRPGYEQGTGYEGEHYFDRSAANMRHLSVIEEAD